MAKCRQIATFETAELSLNNAKQDVRKKAI